MKKIKILFLIIFLSFLTFIPVKAADLGAIRGTYSYDNHPFTNQAIYLYKIADMKELESDDKFTYLEPYSNLSSNINNVASSEWQNFANELKSYIVANSITYDIQVITDMDGNYEFAELSNGLYLMLVDDIETNGVTYSSLPTLISLPTYNETAKDYLKEITVKSKIEEIRPEPPKPAEPTPEVPQTSDDVMIYIIIFVLAIIILLGTGYYIYKTKKETDANEKSKD